MRQALLICSAAVKPLFSEGRPGGFGLLGKNATRLTHSRSERYCPLVRDVLPTLSEMSASGPKRHYGRDASPSHSIMKRSLAWMHAATSRSSAVAVKRCGVSGAMTTSGVVLRSISPGRRCRVLGGLEKVPHVASTGAPPRTECYCGRLAGGIVLWCRRERHRRGRLFKCAGKVTAGKA